MASVEHCRIDYHPAKKASFTQPRKEPSGKAPAGEKKRQIAPSLKVLDHSIRRNINSYVRNVKTHQCHIELVPDQFGILG
jgi:hypothetical protein